MTEERSYILGTDDEELARLRFQHQAWVEAAYALWNRAGLCAGQTVLDLGCGPGFTSFELAHVVGPSGRVIARDVSPRFLEFLRSECDRTGAPVKPSLGTVEALDLPPESIDAAYARWLFCWLPEPAEALKRVARVLKPGGVVVIQDYIDWGAMKAVPRDEVFDEVILACMQSWAEGGGTINIGDRIPEMAAAAELRIEHFAPVARLGGVGSLEWRWLAGFFESYLPRLVERKKLAAETLANFRAHWAQREAQSDSYVVAPTLANVILRKGGAP
jgi:SAM-dependent methyltransferase